MSDKEKNVPEVDNWTKNAEEHGRMGTQLAVLATQLDALTHTVNKLDDSQKDLRTELVGQILDARKRMDDLRTEMTNQFSSLKDEIRKNKDEALKDKDEARKGRDKLGKEIRVEMRWLTGTMITVLALLIAALKYLPL